MQRAASINPSTTPVFSFCSKIGVQYDTNSSTAQQLNSLSGRYAFSVAALARMRLYLQSIISFATIAPVATLARTWFSSGESPSAGNRKHLLLARRCYFSCFVRALCLPFATTLERLHVKFSAHNLPPVTRFPIGPNKKLQLSVSFSKTLINAAIFQSIT